MPFPESQARPAGRPAPATPRQPPANSRLWVVEIKPNAGYVALGQVLTYAWAFNTVYAPRWRVEPAILTDVAKPYLYKCATAHAVHVLSLERLLVEPPPYPT